MGSSGDDLPAGDACVEACRGHVSSRAGRGDVEVDPCGIEVGEYPVKQNIVLVISSLLSVLLTTFHLTDDIVRGMSPGGIANLAVALVLVGWLYGTLELAGRRAGYVIILVLSLLASALPVVHM